jgi:hypothetical protein
MSDYGRSDFALCGIICIVDPTAKYRNSLYDTGLCDGVTGALSDGLHLPRAQGETRLSLFEYPVI